MSDPLGQDNIREYLMAFADGELDAAQILTVLEYVKAEPASLDLLMEQQALRVAAMHAVRKGAPPVPEGLNKRIAELAATIPFESAPKATASHGRDHWRFWVPALAAVLCLFVGIAIGSLAMRPRDGTSGPVAAVPKTYDVPPSTIAGMTGVHVDCSRFLARLQPGRFPKELGELSAAVREDFSRNEPYPDLSGMGYRFIDAGPCRKPLQNTAHLVYQSTLKDMNDKLSIFVQPIDAQMKLEPGKFYLVSDADCAHPMFAWRTERAMYFLVGDEMETTERARGVLAVAAGL